MTGKQVQTYVLIFRLTPVIGQEPRGRAPSSPPWDRVYQELSQGFMRDSRDTKIGDQWEASTNGKVKS